MSLSPNAPMVVLLLALALLVVVARPEQRAERVVMVSDPTDSAAGQCPSASLCNLRAALRLQDPAVPLRVELALGVVHSLDLAGQDLTINHTVLLTNSNSNNNNHNNGRDGLATVRTNGVKIYSNVGGSLVVDGVRFTGNVTPAHPSTFSQAFLSVSNSIVRNSEFVDLVSATSGADRAFANGGAVFGSNLTVENTLFSGCSLTVLSSGNLAAYATAQGAAISGRISLTVANCTFRNNRVAAEARAQRDDGSGQAYGGAVYSNFGDLVVTDSVFEGNSASSSAGSSAPRGAGTALAQGGAVYSGGPATLTRCTFVNNTAGASVGTAAKAKAQILAEGPSSAATATATAAGGGAYVASGLLLTGPALFQGNDAAQQVGETAAVTKGDGTGLWAWLNDVVLLEARFVNRTLALIGMNPTTAGEQPEAALNRQRRRRRRTRSSLAASEPVFAAVLVGCGFDGEESSVKVVNGTVETCATSSPPYACDETTTLCRDNLSRTLTKAGEEGYRCECRNPDARRVNATSCR